MANNANVGTAYITILPSMKGAQASIASSLVPAAQASGKKAGASAGAGMAAGMKSAAGKVGKAAALGFAAAGVAAAAFVKTSVDKGKEFDSAMSQVAATMGKPVSAINNLRDYAMEMGAKTAFSATQAAEALNYMALAGYDADTSMKMLPNVLNLAAAGNMELAAASDMVTDAQSALGLNIEQTTTMVDQMAKASSTTNTSVEQLGSAMLTVGGTAKMMKGGTAEVAQVLGLLADNGIKGAEGGTALRNILLSLSSPTDKAATQLKALGVEVFDAQGHMRSMKDIIGDLDTAMAGMTDEEKTQAIATIFNKRDLKSVNALLGTNAQRWDEVGNAIENSSGAAQKMADTQLDNLEGDITLLKSAFEGLQITVSDAVTPALRGLVQGVTAGISKVTEVMNSDTFKAFGEVLSSIFEGAGQTISPFLKQIGDGIANFAKQLVTAMQSPAFKQFTTSFAQGFSSLLSVLAPILSTIVDWIWRLLQSLAPVLPVLGQVVSQIGGALFNALRPIGEILLDLGNVIISILGPALQVLLPIIANIMTVFINLWGVIFRIVAGIKDFIVITFNAIKTVIATIMNAIAGIVRNVWGVITNIIRGAANVIKGIINGIKSIVGVVKNIFNSVKNAITGPIDAAKNFISGIVEKIKGFFHFEISLPHIKLPHINFDLIEIPVLGWIPDPTTFSIDWYATGGVFNKPTLAGVGEAGTEILSPEPMLRQIVAEESGNDRAMGEVIELLRALLAKDESVYLDGRELVNSTVGYMDKALGGRSARSARGVAV